MITDYKKFCTYFFFAFITMTILVFYHSVLKVHSLRATIETKRCFKKVYKSSTCEYEIYTIGEVSKKYKIITTEDYVVGSTLKIDINNLRYVIRWDVN